MTTTTKKPATILIESNTTTGEYGRSKTEAIIEANGRRLYICEGFGGMDSLSGGAIRWRHGIAIEIAAEDTLESLKTRKWNDHVTYYDAMHNGYYGEIKNWSGIALTKTAVSLGL